MYNLQNRKDLKREERKNERKGKGELSRGTFDWKRFFSETMTFSLHLGFFSRKTLFFHPHVRYNDWLSCVCLNEWMSDVTDVVEMGIGIAVMIGWYFLCSSSSSSFSCRLRFLSFFHSSCIWQPDFFLPEFRVSSYLSFLSPFTRRLLTCGEYIHTTFCSYLFFIQVLSKRNCFIRK